MSKQSDYQRGRSEVVGWIDAEILALETKVRSTEDSREPYWKGFVTGLQIAIGKLKELKKDLE